ncbi:MAG: hypothetical protein AAFW70_18885, partial [Cyanobacteria bacterium J06635_10]
MGRLGDGEMGRWGDWEMGRLGDGEIGRWGDWEMGRIKFLILNYSLLTTDYSLLTVLIQNLSRMRLGGRKSTPPT